MVNVTEQDLTPERRVQHEDLHIGRWLSTDACGLSSIPDITTQQRALNIRARSPSGTHSTEAGATQSRPVAQAGRNPRGGSQEPGYREATESGKVVNDARSRARHLRVACPVCRLWRVACSSLTQVSAAETPERERWIRDRETRERRHADV